MRLWLFIPLAVLLLCNSAACGGGGAVREYTFRVVHTYPHDSQAFTQGLEYRNGVLYEGTGINGRSGVRAEQLETGKVLESVPIDADYFGEGITVIGSRILELTWLSHIGFVYDRATWKPIGIFRYPGEGWGLANDGTWIYMTDGTDQIRILDSQTLGETRRISVHDGTEPVKLLNEIECVRGEIYANVWHTDRIARICPEDGLVTGWIDLSGLLPENEQPGDEGVLNGIAYDAAHDRLFVTGKLWPKLFEIKLIPK